MVVSLAVFALGGGVSIYEGAVHLLEPHSLDHLTATYVVLGCSVIFEGTSLTLAIIEFRKSNPGITLLRSLRKSKDPASFTVLFEDGAAVLGIAVAVLATRFRTTLPHPLARRSRFHSYWHYFDVSSDTSGRENESFAGRRRFGEAVLRCDL